MMTHDQTPSVQALVRAETNFENTQHTDDEINNLITDQAKSNALAKEVISREDSSTTEQA